MDNQHRKISGYRELTQADIDMMNKVKALGIEIEILINDIKAHHGVSEEVGGAERARWLAMGRSDLQTGLMKITRSIAQPGFF